MGDAKFSDSPVNIRDVEYTSTKDTSDWKHVERLVEQCRPKHIPVPKGTEVKPSGFFLPRTKPGDLPYFVRRAPSWLYPVYVQDHLQQRGGYPGTTVTMIKKVEGDVFELKKDIDKFLYERYEREFIGQANEIMQKIMYRGNFDKDFKDFLK